MLVLVRVLAALCLSAPLVSADHVRLLHRVFHKDINIPSHNFVLRATLDPSGSSLDLHPAPHFHDDLARLYHAASQHPGALYQLALQHPTDAHADSLDISSVKACHLPLASADHLTLHLADDGAPFHIDYYLADVPPSGVCPSKKQLRAQGLSEHLTFLPPANTTVHVRRAAHPPLPELRAPPPLTPQGAPVVPEPEKTFIQKYWVYLVIGLGGLLLAGGGPEEEGAAPPSGGGGGSGRQ